MSKHRRLAGVLVLAGVVALVLLLRRPSDADAKGVDASAPGAGESSRQGAPTGGKASASLREHAGRARPGFSFDGITSASELQRMLQSGKVSKGQALDYMLQAAVFCENSAIHRKYKTERERAGRMPPAELAHLRHAREYSARFCDVPLPSSYELQAQLIALDVDDDVARAAALNALADSETASVGVPQAAELIRSASDPDALVRAQYFLSTREQWLPQAGRVALPASLADSQSRFDAELAAVRMITCEMRGGCGVNGFYTQYFCDRSCRPGDSLRDVWQRSLTPDQLAYARALAAAIRADRRDAP